MRVSGKRLAFRALCAASRCLLLLFPLHPRMLPVRVILGLLSLEVRGVVAPISARQRVASQVLLTVSGNYLAGDSRVVG
eukprot:2514349-Pyramimonas_sp.AAC.1